MFPSGKTYLTGAFNISSNTRVQIERGAMVLGSTRGQDWPVVVAAKVLYLPAAYDVNKVDNFHFQVWPQFGHGSDCIPGDPTCRLMHQSLLFGWNLRNISIGGGGSFNCNSQEQTWWGCAKNLAAPPCSGAGRPHCMMLANVTDVDVSFLNVSNRCALG